MHVSRIPSSGLNWLLRPLFWLQRRRYGTELNPALTWARIPRLYWALLFFYGAIERRGSPIDAALRSLIQTYVSQLNHCEFCVDLNAAIAAQRLGTTDKLLRLSQWESSDVFTLAEKLCLQYARDITLSDRTVSADLIDGLHQQFSEAELIELTALISFQNMSSKFNAALDIESQGLCQLPAASAVPTKR